MDKDTRNTLRNVVTNCRQLLEDAVAQVLEGQYGIYPSGRVDDVAKMDHLAPDELDVRERIVTHLEHIQSGGFKPADAADQLIREIAFTHLNRFAAYKMMERRGLIREAVSRGLKSQGFMFYLADHPDDEHLWSTGQQELAYRHFLVWQGEQFANEISVLFSPYDPANVVFPPQRVLDQVLDLINSTELADIWTEDETIGWVYQYFTPKELRDKARSESQAPRNSYELAFRNQFYTPRYVVEFLTDNTLGRTWYEMLQGDTALIDHCQYLVRRPNEIFLAQGEDAPESDIDTSALSQEELLQQPVYIPYRALKDPRRLKVLDPACGSGHFLLYAFDLLAIIYEEAWERDVIDPNSVEPRLREKYATLDDLRCDIPRLILARNLHGIDIDRRATQIAALALWLRAQRYYNDHKIDRKNRPAITQGNIVVAEPMPGDRRLLDEFTAELESPIDQMVKRVFNEMKLAGEAGSLLKIEEAIQDDIAHAREEWERGLEHQKTPQQMALLPDWIDKKPEQLALFDVSKITDAEFFDRAEQMVLDALRVYAQQAENGHGLRRRLFAEDAAGGFAFIEALRKRYDAVLMNPPFGSASKKAKDYLDTSYPCSKNDIYACFIENGLHQLNETALLGAITSRTGFFLTSLTDWREKILLQNASPAIFADLGQGVLDTAMVETAAYSLQKVDTPSQQTIFIRVLEDENKANELRHIRLESDKVVVVTPTSFKDVPNSPFAYWVSERFRALFKALPQFETEDRIVRVGLQTADDFRFVRLWWEVASENILSGDSETTRDQFVELTKNGRGWAPFAKGGSYSPYYSDLHLILNWYVDGEDLKWWAVNNPNDPSTTHYSRNIRSEDCYFLPGLTYPRRVHRLPVAPLPRGSIISVRSTTILAEPDHLKAICGLTNSSTFDYMFKMMLGRFDFPEFTVGALQQLPVPETLDIETSGLANEAWECSKDKQYLDTVNEVSHVFQIPVLLLNGGDSSSLRVIFETWLKKIDLISTRLVERQSRIDEIAFALYQVDARDKRSIKDASSIDLGISKPGYRETASDLLAYLVGCFLGRWDIRYAIAERYFPELPDPFDPLPACPPGMLQNADGLPATETPPGYPLDIDWDGILVDDPDHPDDIIRRVRGVLEVLWGDRAEAIEQEACEILGVKDLRDYFRKSGKGGFWDDHVKRYSKSRRKAPIYWLLQSSRKNYALWLYYHRLDKDLYYKALINYVQPKLRLEQNNLNALRTQLTEAGVAGREAKRLEREVEQQEALMSELQDFHDALERAAQLNLEPDLNDGVVLNIAPLHELVPWKEAETYWKALLKGEYEWSTISQQLRERGMI